jgi:glutamine cyclotransferase
MLPFDVYSSLFFERASTGGNRVAKWITWRRTALLLIFLTSASSAAQGQGGQRGNPGGAGLYSYRVVRSYPHDPGAFTQGLVYDGGFFYEGTGLYGHSTLRLVEPASGGVVKKISLAPSFFGEGIAVSGNRIIQLTWKSRTGFVYKKDSFELIGKFSYDHEGWGATSDPKELIISDGTSLLHFWDPHDLREKRRVSVHDGHYPVKGINELEYVQGDIFANVWPTNYIAVINPVTGRVKGWLNMSGLLSATEARGADVLNGIAYDAKRDRLFVTGKLWPKIFEIELLNKLSR